MDYLESLWKSHVYEFIADISLLMGHSGYFTFACHFALPKSLEYAPGGQTCWKANHLSNLQFLFLDPMATILVSAKITNMLSL